MYATYKMRLSALDKEKLSNYSDSFQANESIKRFGELAHKVSQEGFLQMEELAENWFPDVDTRVFISHSHADEKVANRLANYLQKNFKIKSFIDSNFWGYSLDLLKEIDNEFCLNSNKKTYSYDLRNQSTSHIHMMLATSLAKMMDKCECFIFLDTGNSVREKNTELYTHSAWINYEIYLSSFLRRKEPYRTYPLFDGAMDSVTASFESGNNEYIAAEYRIDLSKLKQIELSCLDDFKKTHPYVKTKDNPDRLPQEALDFLYQNQPFLILEDSL